MPWEQGGFDSPRSGARPRTAARSAPRRAAVSSARTRLATLQGLAHDLVLAGLCIAIVFAALVLFAEISRVGPFASQSAPSALSVPGGR